MQIVEAVSDWRGSPLIEWAAATTGAGGRARHWYVTMHEEGEEEGEHVSSARYVTAGARRASRCSGGCVGHDCVIAYRSEGHKQEH